MMTEVTHSTASIFYRRALRNHAPIIVTKSQKESHRDFFIESLQLCNQNTNARLQQLRVPAAADAAVSCITIKTDVHISPD